MRINLHHLIEPVHQLMTLYDMPMSSRDYEKILEKILEEGRLVFGYQNQLLSDDELVLKLIEDLERLVMIREKMLGKPLDDWTSVFFSNGANDELYDQLAEALLRTLSEAPSGV